MTTLRDICFVFFFFITRTSAQEHNTIRENNRHTKVLFAY